MPSEKDEKRSCARAIGSGARSWADDARPRLSIYRSLHHIYAQVISDESGRTLLAASTLGAELAGESEEERQRLRRPRRSAKRSRDRCLKNGIKEVVFDRNGFLYHGRIKALADAAREAGLKF